MKTMPNDEAEQIQELVEALKTARKSFAIITDTCANIKQARELASKSIVEINPVIGRYQQVSTEELLDRLRRSIERNNSMSKEDLRRLYQLLKEKHT